MKWLGNRWISVPALVLVAAAVVYLAWPQVDWVMDFRRGNEAYSAGRYSEAAEAFAGAAASRPGSLRTRQRLAAANSRLYVPGGESPDNLRLAQSAHDGLDAVLQQNPSDIDSLLLSAALYLNEQKLDEAADGYRAAVAAQPSSAEAHYALGRIAWLRFSPAYWAARAEFGLLPDDAGRIPDERARRELEARWSGVVEEGIGHLRRAVELDAARDDAMACLALLLRARAGLAASSGAGDLSAAAEWAARAREARKSKPGAQ